MKHTFASLFLAISVCIPSLAQADPILVKAVRADPSGDSWNFSVTLLHPDTGWDHFADGWEVQSPDGAVLGHRTLAHPHESEQPFTRSLGGVEVPTGIDHVIIRAHCSVDGWAGKPFELTLNR